EADIESLADIGADACAVHQVFGLLVELDTLAELVFDADVGVIEVVTQAPIHFEPVAERKGADDIRGKAIQRAVDITSLNYSASWTTEIDVVELERQELVEPVASKQLVR